MRRPLRLRAALTLAGLALTAGLAWTRDAAPPGPAAPSAATATAEERGRSLYVTGRRLSGSALLAQLGSGDVVSAAELPCVGCHGDDGRGRPEGGVRPSDIRLSSLTRPYDVVEGTGRHRAPYDERKVTRAVAMGFDSSGTPLHAAMPRYRLSREDATDLLAYLAVVGDEPRPGLTDTTIRVGYLEPPRTATHPGEPHEARAALESVFETLNRSGGVYRRRVDLVSAPLPALAAERAPAVRAFLAREMPFVVIGLVLHEDDAPLAALFEAARVPAIAAVSAAAREQGRYLVPLFPAAAPAGMSGPEGALASAAVLVEGLKRAGRELSREALLSEIGGARGPTALAAAPGRAVTTPPPPGARRSTEDTNSDQSRPDDRATLTTR